MSINHTFSSDSYSERDETRREFVNSSRVMTSMSPTPLSETVRDFRLISGHHSTPVGSRGVVAPLVINGCHCSPECGEHCCISRGLPSTSGLGAQDGSIVQNFVGVKSQDSVSIGSNDSYLGDSGETPLLSPSDHPRIPGNPNHIVS